MVPSDSRDFKDEKLARDGSRVTLIENPFSLVLLKHSLFLSLKYYNHN